MLTSNWRSLLRARSPRARPRPDAGSSRACWPATAGGADVALEHDRISLSFAGSFADPRGASTLHSVGRDYRSTLTLSRLVDHVQPTQVDYALTDALVHTACATLPAIGAREWCPSG